MIFGRLQKKKQQDSKGEAKYTLAGGVPDLRDLAAPDGVKITDSYVQVGPDRFVRAFYVTQVPSSVFVGWLDDLYNIGDVDVSIHLYPGNNREVIEELSIKINDLMATQILDEKRGDFTNASLTRATLEDAWQLREEIQTNRNKMFYVTILFTVAAESLEELERKSRVAEEMLGGRAIHIRQAFLRQDEALKSVSPIGVNKIVDVYRNFDLGASTALMPFNCADMAHEGGVFLGVNLNTGAPVLAYHGFKTLYIVPEGEYGEMTEELGGINIKLSPEKSGYLNPFDLELDEDGGKEYVNLKEKVADLKGLISVMIEGSREKMTPEELVLVEDCLFEEYHERGITNDPKSLYEKQNIIRDGVYTTGYVKKSMPTLSSFYERLKTKGPKVERLLLLLKPYLKDGSMGLFDGESEINLKDARLINFDISGLEERFLRPFAMHVILSWVWEEFVKGDKDSQKIVVVDEAWLSLKYKDSTDFLENMARRARKRKCSLCVATQNFKEFTNIPQGVAILSNIGTKIFMQQNPEEIDDVTNTFKLSDGQRSFLEKAGIGEAIIAAGKQVAAVLFTPTEFEKRYVLKWEDEAF